MVVYYVMFTVRIAMDLSRSLSFLDLSRSERACLS